MKIVVLLLLLALLSCHTKQKYKYPETRLTLTEKLSAILDDPNLANTNVGIWVEALDNGEILYQESPYKLFMPASNMKLFTSAAGLQFLGPDFRYTTTISHTGTLEEDVLKGDLYIHGAGDPTISSRFSNDDPTAIFKSWADSLKAKGIHKITGDLIGDISAFRGDRIRNSWEWDDLSYYYAPRISALSYNDNCIDLDIVAPKQKTDSLIIIHSPLKGFITIVNNLEVVGKDSSRSLNYWRELGTNRVHLRGKIPADGDTIRKSITVEQPEQLFLETMYRVLGDNGVTFSGGLKVCKMKPNKTYPLKLLFNHNSVLYSDIINVINKPSNNFFAEQVLNTIALVKDGAGSGKRGSALVLQWLYSIGVAPDGIRMKDGSGLSRQNLVAPASTAALLRYMYQSKYYSDYYDSLPIAGIDGTIKNQMRGTLAEGNVHAKTGTLTRVRSLSGYVTDQSGRSYLFVTMFNNFTTPVKYIKSVQDRLCVVIASHR